MSARIRPTFLRGALGAALALALGGCTTNLLPWFTPAPQQALPISPADRAELTLVILPELASRRSALPANSSYERIAKTVAAQGDGPEASEQRRKALQAMAQHKEWIAGVGGLVNLTTLGAYATEVPLTKDRTAILAEVDLAAATLALEANTRIHDALTLYIEAEAARERAAIADRLIQNLGRFDPQAPRIAQARQTQLAEQQKAEKAAARLNQIAKAHVAGSAGPTQLPAPKPETRPLSVILAQAEVTRDLAQGVPTLAMIDKGQARITAAQNDASLRLTALQRRIATLAAQERAQRQVSQQMAMTLTRAVTLPQAGAPSPSELPRRYETLAEIEKDLVNMRQEMAKAALDIAKEQGVLADGGRI